MDCGNPLVIATGLVQPVTKNPVATAPGSDLLHDETVLPVVRPRHPTRIILFTVGFVTAIALILLLSFNFRPGSSGSPTRSNLIAVLPLKPLNAENREPIYELGIADSLISSLAP